MAIISSARLTGQAFESALFGRVALANRKSLQLLLLTLRLLLCPELGRAATGLNVQP
jgi:hypothetical protein